MEDSIFLIVFLILLLVLVIIERIFVYLTVPVIAQRKGYNVYAWIVVAWFLGILSYFLILRLKNNNTNNIVINENQCMNSATNAAKPVAKVKFSAWICPKCGEKNSYDAKNCINCFEPKP